MKYTVLSSNNRGKLSYVSARLPIRKFLEPVNTKNGTYCLHRPDLIKQDSMMCELVSLRAYIVCSLLVGDSF